MPSTPQILVPNRYHVVPRTILFVFHNEKVLLQQGSKDKKINRGLWNGLGGHIERKEDVITAATRELFEEAGIKAAVPDLCGTIMIDVNENEGILLFVFTCDVQSDDFTDSSEGKLNWFLIDQIPKEAIVDDVPHLLSRVMSTRISGKQFHLLYSYDSAGNRITTEG